MLIILIFLFDPEACIRRKEQELISLAVIFLLHCFDLEGNINFFFFSHVAEKKKKEEKKIESEITPTKAVLGVGGFGKGSIGKKVFIMIEANLSLYNNIN